VLHAGRAVVTTSLALSLGCFVLTLSSWQSVASFGFLSGLAILVALVAGLVILPAVIAAAEQLAHARTV
jgi:predicted RND superfamily exporter protein